MMAANVHITTGLVLVCLLLAAQQCHGDVVVKDRIQNKTLDMMADMPALFGPQLSLMGMKGLLHIAKPLHACGHVHPPPSLPDYTPLAYARWIALIHRNNCSYADKVLNAQAAGYSAVIVMNIGSDFIEPMSAADGDAENITIPSVFIGQSDGDNIELFFKDYNRYGFVITGQLPFNIQSYLLPFAITIAICFVAMLISMIIKCVRDYRRSRRHRLSWRSLRRLPLHRFNPAVDPYEVCAICLEDYVEGDKLRILPCNHAYHSCCIDPWLTKRRRVCPVCKQKVRVGGEAAADDTDDDDSDTERGTSERAPLLQQATQVSAGTFANNRENPFQRASRRSEERRQRRENRPGYNQLDDSIDTASNLSSDGNSSDSRQQQNVDTSAQAEAESTASSVAQMTASMLPGEDEQVPDDLDVVTITRSIKKKGRKKKSKKSKGEEGEEEGPATEGEERRDCLVQIDDPAQQEAGAEATASVDHPNGDPIV